MKDKANSITLQDVEQKLSSIEYRKHGEKTMSCLVTTVDGFEVLGVAYCFDKSKFDLKIGQQSSYEDALNQLKQLIAYKVNADLRTSEGRKNLKNG
jgi:hypothetical protein